MPPGGQCHGAGEHAKLRAGRQVEAFCGNTIREKQKRELLKIYLTKLRETLARAPPHPSPQPCTRT